MRARWWEALHTRLTAGELLLNLFATVHETRPNLGMECCSMSSLACSQVKGPDQTIFAASARRETQGTSKVVRGGDDAAYAEIPHTDNAGLLAALVLCYRTRTAARWTVRTVGGSKVDLSGVGCTDSREAVFPRVLPICVQYVEMAGSDRGVVEGPR